MITAILENVITTEMLMPDIKIITLIAILTIVLVAANPIKIIRFLLNKS